jgi:nucleoid-associated protein YgaU
MLERTPTKLVITRPNPFSKESTGVGGTAADFESTVLDVSLEGYTIEEDAENAYDITVSVKFKEYIAYGTVKQTVVINENQNDNGGSNTSNNNNNNTSVEVETKPVTKNQSYTIVKGDTLGKISKKFYGVSSKWEMIYEANKTVIEADAKKHGRSSSSKGNYIYPGTKLVIPMTNN